MSEMIQEFDAYKYLSSLSEETIYTNYLTLWPTRFSMEGLSQENKMLLLNFKVQYQGERQFEEHKTLEVTQEVMSADQSTRYLFEQLSG
jgi:hypothetical protein